MEENGQRLMDGSKTNARSTDSLKYLIKHSELQPCQKDLLYSFMEAQKGQTRLVIYGRRHGKSAMLEYMKQTGQVIEEAQDPSATKRC
jgi:hypothetical protein